MAIQLFPSPFRRSPRSFQGTAVDKKTHVYIPALHPPRAERNRIGACFIFLYCCELSFPRREDIFRNIFVPHRSFPPRVHKNSRPGKERRSGREFVLGYVDRCYSNFFKWTEKASFPLSSRQKHEEKDFADFLPVLLTMQQLERKLWGGGKEGTNLASIF